ncbi:O-antigen ligase family protein [Clostridium perfringens]|nr:O-antigen ligase family protein [Clostridium perfringens]
MNNKYKFINFILVLLMIMLSKTIFWGGLYKDIVMYIYIIICVIIILLKGISRKNLYILIHMLILSGISVFINFYNIDNLSWISIKGMVLELLTVAIISSYLTKKEFIKNYVNIMVVISLISLIHISIVYFSPNFIELISKKIFLGNHPYIISPFYTWGWNDVFERNSGPFWEPGAFQGYINIAILAIIFYKNDIKNLKYKILILITTLITTQSTTGYIVFLIIIIMFGINIIKEFTNNLGVKILIIFMIIGSGVYIISSNNISNKLEFENGSTIMRSNDFEKSLKMISEKPLAGYGNSYEKLTREKSLGIISNSNGILAMTYTYGIIFSTYYIYRLIVGLQDTFTVKSIIKRIGIILIFIILHCTEGLIWLPIYLIFIFQWKYEENNNTKMRI